MSKIKRKEFTNDLVYNQMYFGMKQGREGAPDEPLTYEYYLKQMEDKDSLRRLKMQKNNVHFNDNCPRPIEIYCKKLEPVQNQPLQFSYTKIKEGIDFKVWAIFRLSFAFFFWTSFCLLIGLFALDVRNKINSEIEHKRLEVEICQIEYRDNHCEAPLPALKTFCLEKEKCMVTNVHASVMKVKHMVLVITDILNSSVASCNSKTLAFAALVTFGYLFFEIFSRRKLKAE